MTARIVHAKRPSASVSRGGRTSAAKAAAFLMSTAIMLAEVAERTDRLEVVCRKCDRHGVVSIGRQIREHGPRFPMTELLRVLAGDCERMKAGKAHDPCGCHFPELPRLFGVATG